MVSWQKPPTDVVCLTVDGSVSSIPAMVGFSGLVCDSAGNFVYGFCGSLGDSEFIHAKLMILLHGLRICWEMGIMKIICYSNSLHVLHLIEHGNQNLHRYGREIAIIREFLHREWDCLLVHTLRDGNHYADFMAKLGARASDHLILLSSPPRDLVSMIEAGDAVGTVFVRVGFVTKKHSTRNIFLLMIPLRQCVLAHLFYYFHHFKKTIYRYSCVFFPPYFILTHHFLSISFFSLTPPLFLSL